MDEFKKRWQSLSDGTQGFLILLVIGTAIFIGVTIHSHVAASSNQNSQTTHDSQTVTPPADPVTASSILADINSIRTNSNHMAFLEDSQLDSAATARAQYMATNNVLDNSTGDPWGFVTRVGFYYSTGDLMSTWNEPSAQDAAKNLTTGGNASYSLSDSYYDIGVGTAPAIVSGDSTQIVVAYIANPQTAQQTYWYCWDTGNPSPHHLGYPVSGDHFCTNQELHNAGFDGY